MTQGSDLMNVTAEIGVGAVLLKSCIGLSRTTNPVKVSLTTSMTQPGVWLHFQQCIATEKGVRVPAHLLTGEHSMIVELDEEQTEVLLLALLKAVKCHAYGAGINDMGGM